MISIKSISFSTAGWTPYEDTPQHRFWVNRAFQEMLSLEYFPSRPDIPFNISQIDSLRDSMATVIQPKGGEVVELDVETIANLEALRRILKFPLNQDGRGRAYLASFTFPFESFSFVVKVQCPEIGTTGIRESVIVTKLMRDGKLDLGQPQPGGGPIPPEAMRLINTTADSPEYDQMFPNHPLSRARAHLKQIRESLAFEDTIYDAPPFRIP